MDAVASFEMVIKPQERLYLKIVSSDFLNCFISKLPLWHSPSVDYKTYTLEYWKEQS